ncbi:hypothetical protein M3Y98_00441600 [Aphelenchoides besseyi]|nr:hypothetical protein M3Y98_00441600 [Aphelenchoides besseyi]KAI6202549.1 hypothetical protein M3Y96_00960600 [Aphelenchoides besseyi]
MEDKLTDLEISFSPSYFSMAKETPKRTISKWLEFQRECLNELRSKFKCEENCAYGTTTRSNFDVWYPDVFSTSSQLHCFIHGGFWQECDKTTYASVPRALLKSGVKVVMLEYDHATTILINDLILQVQSAISLIRNRYPTDRLTISGHSAGAHLVAKILETQELAALFDAAVLFCGVYDLKPLVETYIGRNIDLTLEMAENASVNVTKLAKFNGSLLFVEAEHDAPGLIEQGRKLVENLRGQMTSGSLQTKSYKDDHFSIISALADVDSLITKDFVDFITQSQ